MGRLNASIFNPSRRQAYSENDYISPTMFIDYPYWALAMENDKGEILDYSGDGIGLGMPKEFEDLYSELTGILGIL